MPRLPPLSFDLLWHARRCPRRFRALLAGQVPVDSRFTTWDLLHHRSKELMGVGVEGEEMDELDHVFQTLQEKAVSGLSRRLLTRPLGIVGESLWEEEGESLRELGWLSAVKAPGGKMLSLNKDNWVSLVSRMEGLYRPVLKHDSFLARPDYLLRTPEGSWMIILVRASAKIKDAAISEAEYTRWVCQSMGLQIDHAWLLHTREDYIRSPQEDLAIDPASFFSFSPLNALMKHLLHPLSQEFPRLLEKAVRNDPCRHSDTCPFCGAPQAPDPDSIQTLHRPGRAIIALEAEGIRRMQDLEKASPLARKELKDRHWVQMRAVTSGQVQVDVPQLSAFLEGLDFPLSFLDFESTSEALPPVLSSRPWEHIPFLYSLLVLRGVDSIRDHALLSEADPELAEFSCIMDARDAGLAGLRSLAGSLLQNLPSRGSILAYGAAFETATLRRLGRILPDLEADLEAVARRVVDLQIPFMNFWYYHPGQLGKLSLKRILPLMSRMSHQELNLRSGGEAHLRYYFWKTSQNPPPGEDGADKAAPGPGLQGDDPTADLVAYCRMDTLGLVHVLKALVRCTSDKKSGE